MPTPKYEYIDTTGKLEQFCSLLQQKPWIVLDTEFIREKTFLPELCLVQIKADEHLAVVDTLKTIDLSSLSALLHDPAITKVFHAGSQDLEIFYWLDGKVPAPLFDTQIAAPLLGFSEQIGYGNLVGDYLGINLDKAHSRADWTRRPLPDKQLLYALDDVIYLEKIYVKMLAELKTRNRLDWITPEFQAQEEPERYNKPASDRWKKMRAAQKMKGPALSVLQALTEWRETEAMKSNIPRNWLLKDDTLAALAREMPADAKDLGHIRGLGSRIKSGHATTVLEIIREAAQREPEAMPAIAKKKKLKPEQLATIDLLAAVVAMQSVELDINPSVLASRKDLEACVAAGSSEPLKGWRRALISEPIDDILSGKSRIHVKNSVLVVEPVD